MRTVKRARQGNGFISDLFKSKTTYSVGNTKKALSAAYSAGKDKGDTGEFELWWTKYSGKTGVNKKKAESEFRRGVDGEPSTKAVVEKKAVGIRGKHRGCNIYFDPESKEFYTSCDKDSKFDTRKEAVEHINYVKDKLRKNPGVLEITEGFHGRDSTEETEIIEEESFEEELAGLGILMELVICDSEDTEKGVPIKFNHTKANDMVLVACGSDGTIELIGGDQDLDVDKLEERLGQLKDDNGKPHNKVTLGYIYSICYWADKHHLEGPKYQAKGAAYEHTFAEDGGEMPMMVYDFRNKKIELVGGSYTITDEGIRN